MRIAWAEFDVASPQVAVSFAEFDVHGTAQAVRVAWAQFDVDSELGAPVPIGGGYMMQRYAARLEVPVPADADDDEETMIAIILGVAQHELF